MKSSFRKIASSILTAFVACSFFACGDSDSGTSPKNDVNEVSSSSVVVESSSSPKGMSSSSTTVVSSSNDADASLSSSVVLNENVESSSSGVDEKLSSGEVASSSSNVEEKLSSSGEKPASSSAELSSSSGKAMWVYLNPEVSYGEMVDDRDGQVYKTVVIGSQTWMAENLNYNYNKGSIDSKCYNDESQNCEFYGRLYSWVAAIDSIALASEGFTCGSDIECDRLSDSTLAKNPVQGACPTGWHLPSLSEWSKLDDAVYDEKTGAFKTGTPLKATARWYENGEGTNTSGFTAFPAGEGSGSSMFENYGKSADFWSASVYKTNAVYAYAMSLSYLREDARLYNSHKGSLHSIRCLKD